MRVGGRTVAFYNVLSASIGFQLGAQARSVIIMFMTPLALDNFQRIDGWRVGVDGSVVLVVVGLAARSTPTRSPIRWSASSSTRRG